MPVIEPEERFQFGSYFGSGVLENVAKGALDAIEPAINTATGVVARALPMIKSLISNFVR